jgi:hypothetical protein
VASSQPVTKNPLTLAFLLSYIPYVEWAVLLTDEFEIWWDGLSEEEQEDVNASVMLLQQLGPMLRFPHSSGVESSNHAHMRD